MHRIDVTKPSQRWGRCTALMRPTGRNQTLLEFKTSVDIVSLELERRCDIHRERENVSGEVFPSADEAGGAETRSDGAVWQPGSDAVPDPGLDIDVSESPDSDHREFFTLTTRDAVSEVKKHDQVIMRVIKSHGGNAGMYKRERKAAIRAVVSEIYSPSRVTAAAKLLP